MSDTENQNQSGPSELEVLKMRANTLGITYGNAIGVEGLKKKIQAKLDGEPEPVDTSDEPNPLSMGAKAMEKPVVAGPMSLRNYLRAEALKLVRCSITNLDPKKKDLPGEIITVANEYIGTVRCFVPFGEQTEEGWHIPHCIYEFLKARKFVHITTTRDRRTRAISQQQRDVPEFAIVVMEPLTTEELSQLAQAQIAAGSIESK